MLIAECNKNLTWFCNLLSTVITRRRTAVTVINVACTSNIASVTDTRELVDTIATMTCNQTKDATLVFHPLSHSRTHSLTHSLARLNRQGVGKRFRHHCLLCDGNINLRNKKLTRICSKLKYHEHKERGCSHRNQRRMSFQHSQGYKCTWSCWCHRYSVLKQKKHDHRHLHSSG